MNKAVANGHVEKYYLTIAKGNLKDKKVVANLNRENNRTVVSKTGKESISEFKNLKYEKGFSLVEVNLITGRTHQIRSHLNSIKHPIIGDGKYGDNGLNREFREKYGVNRQLLHAYKIILNGFDGELSYLNGKTFISKLPKDFSKVVIDLFGEDYESLYR